LQCSISALEKSIKQEVANNLKKKFIGSFRWTKSRLPICLSVLTSKVLHTHPHKLHFTHSHTHTFILTLTYLDGHSIHFVCPCLCLPPCIFLCQTERKKTRPMYECMPRSFIGKWLWEQKGKKIVACNFASMQ
jgi:hypothetical protein